MKLRNNLRKCRFERDEITQEVLAKEVGVTRQTIISIEKSKYVPSALLALKLVKYFGKRFEEVFYIIDDVD